MRSELNKQPGEKFPVSVDFSAANEALNAGSSAVTVFDSAGADVTGTILVNSGLQNNDTGMWARIQGGSSGETYKVSFRAVTITNADVYEHDVFVKVREI